MPCTVRPRPEIAAATRSAIRSPVKPTSSCSSAGLPCVTYSVGQPDPQDPRRDAGVVERLPHRRAEAAREHALLDRHQQVVLGRQLGHQAGVDRLGEARVRDRHRDLPAAQLLGGR